VHFPIRRGELNIHKHVGGSLSSVMMDLKNILEYALTKKLKIDLQTISSFKAVLIIPDIFIRAHLRELTDLLLDKIGFGYCFLAQDHVLATFGCGYASACVVDVGDMKTSISCKVFDIFF
jgi:actin-related protein 8